MSEIRLESLVVGVPESARAMTIIATPAKRWGNEHDWSTGYANRAITGDRWVFADAATGTSGTAVIDDFGSLVHVPHGIEAWLDNVGDELYRCHGALIVRLGS